MRTVTRPKDSWQRATFAGHGEVCGPEVSARRDHFRACIARIPLGESRRIREAVAAEHGVLGINAAVEDGDLDPLTSVRCSAKLSPQFLSPNGRQTGIEGRTKGDIFVYSPYSR